MLIVWHLRFSVRVLAICGRQWCLQGFSMASRIGQPLSVARRCSRSWLPPASESPTTSRVT